FSAIIEELGGFRQVSKVIPLIQQFALSEEALGVALEGQGSLIRDAAIAQQSLQVQIIRVKEEFQDLFRTIAQDAGFRAFINAILEMARSFAQLAKAVTPIITPLSIIAGFRLGKAIPQFFSSRGFPSGFADGGGVPGTGSGDTVP